MTQLWLIFLLSILSTTKNMRQPQDICQGAELIYDQPWPLIVHYVTLLTVNSLMTWTVQWDLGNNEIMKYCILYSFCLFMWTVRFGKCAAMLCLVLWNIFSDASTEVAPINFVVCEYNDNKDFFYSVLLDSVLVCSSDLTGLQVNRATKGTAVWGWSWCCFI